MNQIIKFGEDIEGYNIAVLNEREIRAAAGIFFVLMFSSVMLAFMKADFLMLKYSIIFFLADISIRVFINPKYSPSLIMGRLIVRNQNPEYVGAQQKIFAWIIGVILSAAAFVHIVILNAYSPISGIICFICLIFLFFEAAFGICLGCKVYSMVLREKAQYCPGEVCDIKSRTIIQQVSKTQLIILFGFFSIVILSVFLLNESFIKTPHNLFTFTGKISE